MSTFISYVIYIDFKTFLRMDFLNFRKFILNCSIVGT